MELIINCEHIFFDKFELTDEEKREAAKYIINKVFSEMPCIYELNDNSVTVQFSDFETEMEFESICKLLKNEFFILLKVDLPGEIDNPPVSVIEKATLFIRQNYMYETLSANDVSVDCNTRRNTLDKMFLKEYTMTVDEYIKYIRVEKTKEHIASGKKMEEIAELCGFGSVKTMQRTFKKICGRTPGEYRLSQLDSAEQE